MLVVEAKVEVTFAAALAIQDLKALIVPHARGIQQVGPTVLPIERIVKVEVRVGIGEARGRLVVDRLLRVSLLFALDLLDICYLIL